MTQFLDLLISGLSLGCIYALIAIGFVLVFKATGVVNFAHGSILLLGAYVAARCRPTSASGRALASAAVVARGRRRADRHRARCARCAGAAAGTTRWRSSRSASTSFSPPS